MHLLALALLAAPAHAQEWQPEPETVAVHRALSARHFDGDCARIESLSTTPVSTLKTLVEKAESPPWVPMRAAACLTKGHAAEVQPELEAWVSDAELVGLGIQTLTLLDAMPEPVALAVAKKALEAGPERLEARVRVAEVERPAVRALVEVER